MNHIPQGGTRMTNRERYRAEIITCAKENNEICKSFVVPKILPYFGIKCGTIECTACIALQNIWLEKEYEDTRIQPEVKRLKADDKVLVSMDGVHWQRSYFKEYDAISGKVVVFTDGATSWSNNDCATRKFSYAKLPEENGGK